VEGDGGATTSAVLTVTATAAELTMSCEEAESVTWSSKLYVPAVVDVDVEKLQVRLVGDAQFTAFEYDGAPGAFSSHWYE
jgi:hypothetical protein